MSFLYAMIIIFVCWRFITQGVRPIQIIDEFSIRFLVPRLFYKAHNQAHYIPTYLGAMVGCPMFRSLGVVDSA